MSLAAVERGHEPSQVLMVRPNFNSRGSFEVVVPLLETPDDGEEFFVINQVVDLWPREFL